MSKEVDVEVTRELVLPAPPDEVWEALTDHDRLKEWFANDVEWDGDELVYRWDDGEERRARIDEAHEPRRLGLPWGGGGGGGAPRADRRGARAAPARLPLERRRRRRDARHLRAGGGRGRHAADGD